MVRVDGTDPNKVKDVMGKYGVRGFPTMVFTDPDGKPVGRLGARDAASIAAQFDELAGKYRKRFAFVESVDTALASGRKDAKPVLVLFTDKSKDAEETESAFSEESLQPALARLVAARHEAAKECETCKLYRTVEGVSVVVLDPRPDKPAEAPLASVAGKRSAADLKADLEAALKKWDALKPASASDVEKQCRMWLLLARNFLNQKEFAKAEENVRRVLEKMPEGKLADEAKALQKEIDAAK